MLSRLLTSFTLLVVTQLSHAAQGQTSAEQQVELWLKHLAQQSRYTAVEGANSHGSMGTTIGLGVSDHKVDDRNDLMNEETNIETADESQQSSMSKFWMTKGFNIPLNVGFVGGYDPTTDTSYAGGHLQWSVFEKFKLPSIAVRADHSRMFGLRSSEVSRNSIAAVSSYGFLRYFEAFASLGYSKTLASVEPERSYGGSSIYILSAKSIKERYEAEYRSITSSYGIKAIVLPPFVALSGEIQQDALGLDTFTARIQIGL